jgi:hypothetical protein
MCFVSQKTRVLNLVTSTVNCLFCFSFCVIVLGVLNNFGANLFRQSLLMYFRFVGYDVIFVVHKSLSRNIPNTDFFSYGSAHNKC